MIHTETESWNASQSKPSNWYQYGLILIGLTLLYYAGARLGLFLKVAYGGVTPIWPASGIAVAVFWVNGARFWPMILLGEFFIALTLGQPPVAGLIGGAAQLIEASIAVFFLRRLRLKSLSSSARSVLWFSVAGVLAPPIFSATIGSTTLHLLGQLGPGEHLPGFLIWWLGDAIGILVVAPLLADIKSWPFRKPAYFFYYLGYCFCVAVVGLAIILIGDEKSYYLFFVLVPLVVIGAVNFRLIGAGSATVLLAVLVFGMRPEDLRQGDFITAVRMAFVGTCAFTGYLVTGFVVKRQQRLEIIKRQNTYQLALHDVMVGLMTELDPSRLIDDIVAQACALLDTENGYFCRKKNGDDKMVLAVGKGLYAEFVGLHPDDRSGVVNKVMETGRSMIVNDYQQWDGRIAMPQWDCAHAVIGVPIKVDSDVIGVLGVLSTEKNRPYSNEDLRIIEQFGGLASVAWRNATLYSRLSEQLAARKKAESHLQQLQTAIDFVAEDIMITDIDGVILYVNPGFESVTGYSKEEAIGQTPRILKSGLQGEAFYAALWRKILNGDIWSGRMSNRCKDGRIILQEASIAPICTDNRKIIGFVSVKRDITEHEEIKNRLIQAQKMEAIGALAGGIAHDFNNILSGILGYTELALRFDLPEDHPGKKHMQQVLQAGHRASELVKQILTFSRSSELALHPVDARSIVKEVLQLLRSSIPPDVTVETDFNAEDTCVMAPPTYLHQILMNLLTNAVQAFPNQKGRIRLSLSNTRVTPSEIGDPEIPEAGDYLEITVADTGSGMDGKVIGKIFEPYYTTKPEGKGTGLGLSVVHGIVRDLRGNIKVESRLGAGTTFRVLLPVASKTDPETEINEASLPRGNEAILFIDDNPILTDIGSQLLGKLGYQVTIFNDSMAALEHFRNDTARYDLVITDMRMPKMSGIALAHAIKTMAPGVPIILCTGNAADISAEDRANAGISDYAIKPLNFHQIAGMVRKNLDRLSQTHIHPERPS